MSVVALFTIPDVQQYLRQTSWTMILSLLGQVYIYILTYSL